MSVNAEVIRMPAFVAREAKSKFPLALHPKQKILLAFLVSFWYPKLPPVFFHADIGVSAHGYTKIGKHLNPARASCCPACNQQACVSVFQKIVQSFHSAKGCKPGFAGALSVTATDKT
jgi:hypothetical protein